MNAASSLSSQATRADNRKAVFVQCDGILIEDRGITRAAQRLVSLLDAAEALRRLQQHFLLFLVTCEPAREKGPSGLSKAAGAARAIAEHLQQQRVRIKRIFHCPRRLNQQGEHEPTSFFYVAGQEFGLDLKRSFLISGQPEILALAEFAGVSGICVRTLSPNEHHRSSPTSALVVPGLREAADWISGCLFMWNLEETDAHAIDRAAHILQQGGIGAFPTETVYGLGASIRHETAIARIFEIKARPKFDPLIVHVADEEQLEEIVSHVPEKAHKLITHFWPGPLTLVLPKLRSVPDLVTAGLDTVAVRMPRHPLALALIRATHSPIAAPSANRFGRTSPTTAEHVRRAIGSQIDFLLDGGPCPIGVESSIVSLIGDQPILLRPGGIPMEEIECLTGPLGKPRTPAHQIRAPGMLPHHYAPHTPLRLVTNSAITTFEGGMRVGYIAFRAPPPEINFAAVEVLSPSGNLREAAANLFGALHKLDDQKLDLILAELVPEQGLGRAINDRLNRAAKSSAH